MLLGIQFKKSCLVKSLSARRKKLLERGMWSSVEIRALLSFIPDKNYGIICRCFDDGKDIYYFSFFPFLFLQCIGAFPNVAAILV